jgi:hypothetical protein
MQTLHWHCIAKYLEAAYVKCINLFGGFDRHHNVVDMFIYLKLSTFANIMLQSNASHVNLMSVSFRNFNLVLHVSVFFLVLFFNIWDIRD